MIKQNTLGCVLAGQRTVLSLGESSYPEALARLENPAKELYVIGRVDALTEGIAVAGARKATPYGIACASRFAKIAAEKGIALISGGSLGCDSAALEAALNAGGRAVVFLAGGCDEPYPAANFELLQRVIDADGAVVSERPWNFPPLVYAFRARQRLVAGLARATLVVEAGLPSGTFGLADCALAADREVLAVPGPITSASSAGPNRLICQGATPIVDDSAFHDALSRLYGCII